MMAGVYANFANVSHSDYEFTITFARVDHEQGETGEIPGIIVSRVSLSPRFMRELLTALEDNYSRWEAREGIKSLPEFEGPTSGDERGVGRSPARKASAIPIRSTIGGCVPIRRDSQRGGSGSARFWRVRRCSKEMKASASPVSSSAKASARRSIARESWRETIPTGVETTHAGERQGGKPRLAACPAGGRPGRAIARTAAGATDGREQQLARHVAVAHVRELVRDDRARLRRREAFEQRVVEHDPPARAEPVDVGVRGIRAPARVDRIDLANADAGALARARAPRRAARPRAAASKSLKIGSSSTGAASVTAAATAMLPSAAAAHQRLAVAAPQRGDDDGARGGEGAAERRAPPDVERPPVPRLRGEPGAQRAGAHQRAERQRGERERERERGAVGRGPERSPGPALTARPAIARDERDQQRGLGAAGGDSEQQLPVHVAPCALDLGRIEVALRRHRPRRDHAVAGRERGHRRLRERDSGAEGAEPVALHASPQPRRSRRHAAARYPLRRTDRRRIATTTPPKRPSLQDCRVRSRFAGHQAHR